MRNASYERAGKTIVAPVSLVLANREHLSIDAGSERAACVLALIAAGLVRVTGGNVFVGAFDPRIQPVQVKRLAGYVPHEALGGSFDSLDQYVRYRAALWGVPLEPARSRAKKLREKLGGVHEAFAYPIIGALLARPRLLVLDRPAAAYASQIHACAENTAIFSTHANQSETIAFRKGLLAA